MVLGGTVIVWVTVTSGVAGVPVGVTPGVEVPSDGVVTAEEEVDVTVAVPVVTDGEKVTVGVVGDEDEVHAETATGASRVRAPQQRTVSLALNGVPPIVPRTFMDPSSCAGQMTIVFPFPAVETGIRESADGHFGRAGVRRRCAIASSPSEY
jgi:hypothetical protein